MKTSTSSNFLRKLFAPLCAAVLPAFLATSVNAQIATWNFTGLSSPATANATSSDAKLASVPVLTRGPGASASSASDSFRTTGFQNNGISTTNTDYFQFTMQAAAGQQLSITSISANLAGTSSFSASPGVSNQFAYSLDGTTFTLIGSPVARVGNGAIGPINTSGLSALQNVPSGTTVTIRYYASGQTTTGGWGFSGATGLVIGGTVTSAAAGAPAITSPTTASGTAFTPFTYQITASNSPLSFNATGLPAGLSVNTATGEISGTPTIPGQYNVTISATNGEGTGSAQLSLTIAKNPGAPTITSALTATGLIQTPFSYQIVADNSPTSYSSGTLPTGLTLDAVSGVISGTPTAGGTFNVSITASNALGSDTKTLALTVGAPPVITSPASGSLYDTDNFSYTITASFTPTGFGASNLPAGWEVTTTNGFITNGTTPLVAGTNQFQIFATNSFGTGSTNYTLAVYSQADQNAVPLNVVVNKYVNGTPDRVQLLVVGDGAPGSTVDMRGMIIKDFSSDMANDSGGKFVFANNSLWSAVTAGTLITLSSGTTQAEDIDPADFYLAVNLGNTNYFANGGGSFEIATRDMLLVKAAGSGVSGVAGGIHALAGGTAGAQFTGFSGAKLRSTLVSSNGFGVIASNSTSQLSDFGTSGQPESTDAQGSVASASLDFTTWNNVSNGNYVKFLRGIIDGTGSAIVRNGAVASPFVGQNLFGRNLTGQTVEIVYSPSSATTAINSISIQVPSEFGTPVSGNVAVSGPGAGTPTVGVAGQVVTVSGLAATSPNAVTVAISGLSSPDTATPITNIGSYSFAIQSRGVGGSLSPLAASPAARVVVPIANVRNADPTTFVPVLLGQTVAVEGVCSVGRLSTGTTSSALQDSTHGVYIYSLSAVPGPQIRGNRYAVVGTVAQFSGLVQLNLADPALLFNLGADVDPAPVTVTVQQFNASTGATNGITLQSRVVRIQNLTYVSGTWTNGQNVILQDGSSNQVSVRIQSASTARQPTYPVTLTGIAGQFDTNSPFSSGFQIQPRDQADAPALAPVITSPLTASANANESFSYQIIAGTNPPPTSYGASPLPAGLSVSTSTGLISGTPTEVGTFNVSISATNGGGTATETLVLTVSQAGSTFSGWLGGQPASSENQLKYAIGGATNATATNGIAMSNAVTSTNLSITAIVRTNDPNLSVFGQSIVNLGPGAWATNDVSRITNGVDQTGVPSGNQRQIFSTPRGADGRKFLRLQTTLSNQ